MKLLKKAQQMIKEARDEAKLKTDTTDKTVQQNLMILSVPMSDRHLSCQGKIKPGRSPINTTIAFACSVSAMSSPIATRACLVHTTGPMVIPSASRRGRNSSKNGTVLRCIAVDDNPSPTTITNSIGWACCFNHSRDSGKLAT